MSVSERQILEILNRFNAPGTQSGLVEAGAVRNLDIEEATVKIHLGVQAGAPNLQQEIEAAVMALDEVEQTEVQIQTMLSTLPSAPPPQAKPKAPERNAWADKIAGVKKIIAVASGKGGVGKSTVSANLALALRRAGHSVGLLDADIYGPSQQLMTGATGRPGGTPDGRIVPLESPHDVKVMSLGFIIDDDQPVIWRGPLLMKALEQFIVDVVWGDLDFLVIDLPPGTGDVALTLCQNVPLFGAVIVTTPQDVALIDARKALHMFTKLEVEVLGLVENMSGYTCPECGHKEHIFGSGGGQRTAEELKTPFLGAIPLDPSIVVGGDSGNPIVIDRPNSEAALAFMEIAESLIERSEV